MPRINLLPWREEQRKQRQQQFGIAIVLSVLLAGLVIWLGNMFYQSRIDYQEARNQRLETEIAELNKAIKEIEGLERQKERLLARMEIIEQLQTSRPLVVHLFDELVRTLPEGVYLTGVKQTGREIEITGTAQSSTRVSAFMRNIDASEWLTDPDLEQIRTVDAGQAERFNFTLKAKQVKVLDEDEEEAA